MKQIRRIEIEPAENGGHTVTHHFKETPSHSSKMGMSMRYEEPERHVFGEEDGHGMLAHVANHLGIKAEHDKKNMEKMRGAMNKFIDEEEKE